jgi:hypothetical protein
MVTSSSPFELAAPKLVRLVVTMLAVSVAGWAFATLRMPELGADYDELVWQNVLGEDFTPVQLARLRTPCGRYGTNAHPRAAWLAAMVAVRDLEQSILTGEPEEIQRLAICAGDATRHLIARSPGSSFGWFLLSWITRLEDGRIDRARRYLDRSVELAPRELFMAIKRIPLMQAELARGRFDFVRRDYRSLAQGERPEKAALLLHRCVSYDPLCEMDWNAGLSERETLRVWRAIQAMTE